MTNKLLSRWGKLIEFGKRTIFELNGDSLVGAFHEESVLCMSAPEAGS